MTVQLAVLRGAPKQITWAATLRENALNDNGWSEAQRKTLSEVEDAAWFIANRHTASSFRFKDPAPHQLAGGPPPPVLRNSEHRQPDLLAPDSAKATDNDAIRFAASVSKCPALAETVIVSLLARLYREGSAMRGVLKARAMTVYSDYVRHRDADYVKDVEAIERILRQTKV